MQSDVLPDARRQGNDLPNELLEKIFASIEANPFKLPEDEDGQATAFFNPERDGWLMKEGGKAKNWKKRWFSLVNNCLYYFEKPEDHKPKGTIPLENLFVREIPDSKRANCFEIIAEEGSTVKGAKMDSKGRMVQGGPDHTTGGALLRYCCELCATSAFSSRSVCTRTSEKPYGCSTLPQRPPRISLN